MSLLPVPSVQSPHPLVGNVHCFLGCAPCVPVCNDKPLYVFKKMFPLFCTQKVAYYVLVLPLAFFVNDTCEESFLSAHGAPPDFASHLHVDHCASEHSLSVSLLCLTITNNTLKNSANMFPYCWRCMFWINYRMTSVLRFGYNRLGVGYMG